MTGILRPVLQYLIGIFSTSGVSLHLNDRPWNCRPELEAFVIEGVASKPDKLAAKIVAEVERRIAGPAGSDQTGNVEEMTGY